MPILNAGHTYDLIYLNWHHDPRPRLYVLDSKGDYTVGFNLHYFSVLRYGPDAYNQIPPSLWPKVYEQIKSSPKYKLILEFFEKASEMGMTDTRARDVTRLVSKNWPWAMNAYRKYFSDKIIIRNYIGFGVDGARKTTQ